MTAMWIWWSTVTNPRSHFSVSKACLEAGKHVYSEKPLAMSFSRGPRACQTG